MKIKALPIKGCHEIILKNFSDNRGYFLRVYDKKIFRKIFQTEWLQHNESLNSKKGTFRGLHVQKYPYSEIKLVRVVKGSVIDFIIDLRKNSRTFKKTIIIKLKAGKNMVLIDRGCAHGFLTLENNTIISYLHDNFYSKKNELTISYKELNNRILKKFKFLILSKKDKSGYSIKKSLDKLIF
jgi:dTDP-4-dehydrorhamnose 3,5-epimerase